MTQQDGAESMRSAIDALANQLCVAVDGNFDFAVRGPIEDETIEKLSMLINFVLDTARRGMAALREHNDKLAEIDATKTSFFSNISHELRTPLTLILGPLEDALAGKYGESSSDLHEQLQIAHRNAVRLLKLVNTLLEFSRLEAGRTRAAYEPVDLAAVTADLAAVFRTAIERAGLRYVVDCSALPEPFYVDRDMWEKIVLNLISNALKFTSEGEIGVRVHWTGTHATLTVRDTGIGIAADDLSKIFERFHRVDGARARSHEGSGIGLALVKELVKLQGGTISVQSEPGRGTSFEVRLPAGSAHLPAEQVHREDVQRASSVGAAYAEEAMAWVEAVPAPPITTRGARVLVVDDNADLRAYIARLLGDHWQVELAGDGNAGLEAVRCHPPDLVLTDVMMPGLDGFGLLAALRADERFRGIPVIMLSARAGEEAKVEGRAAGADDYIVKPFTARELIARVGSQLALVAARREMLDSERAARRDAERQRTLMESESRFNAALYRVSASLVRELDTEPVMQLITDEATALVGAQFGSFFFNGRRPDGEAYLLYTLSGAHKEAFKDFPPPRVTPLFATTFHGEGNVRLDDVRRDPRFGAWGKQPKNHVEVVSYLAVPVIGGAGEVLGGLFFGHGAPAQFTAEHERIVTAIATQAAIALEKARLYTEARQSEQRARDADRRKDEFLAMLGHELRNPLAPMLTAIELLTLRIGGDTPEVQVLGRQVRHMRRLVDDLLDMSHITRGKIQLDIERLDLADVIAKALEMASPLYEQRRHVLEVTAPRGLWVDGDAVRLAQVIANLLTNAAKYTDPGGRVELRAAREGNRAVLTVTDNGQGINADLLPHVFDLFVQAPRTPERAQGGLGVGLTLVRTITEEHGGSVRAASEGPGCGSTFTVELPAAEPPSLKLRSPRTTNTETRQRPQKILVVDDNEDAAEMLAVALRHAGHEVAVAHDGPRALELSSVFTATFAFIDIGLPVMDGYELARRLREAHGDRMRLVAVSGYGLDADKTLSRSAEFDLHLTKPADFTRIFDYIGDRSGSGR